MSRQPDPDRRAAAARCKTALVVVVSVAAMATAGEVAAQLVTPGSGPSPGTATTRLAGPKPVPGGPCVWTGGADNPVPRIEAASVVVGERLHVLGGFVTTNLEATTRHDVYDATRDRWRPRAPLPQPVTHAGFTANATSLFVAGGFLGDHPGPVVADVHRYDVAHDAWRVLPPLPEPRGSGALVLLGDELHWFGGVSHDKEVDREEHWVHVLGTHTWTPRAPLPEARNHLAGAALDGRLYAIGGQHGHDANPVDLAFVHRYDPLPDAWTAVQPLPFSRSHFEPGTFVRDGRLVICGGRANKIGLLAVADVTSYDPGTDTWSDLVPLPSALLAPTARVVGDTLVLSGGGPHPYAPGDATFVRTFDAELPATQRINAGGDAWLSSGTPVDSVGIEPATWFCGDLWSTSGMTYQASPALAIAGTDDDVLYRSERSGPDADPDEFAYSIPVPNGTYRVALHFAEIYWGVPGGGPGGAGRRVFDVRVEGNLVLDDLDIFAEVGAATPLVRHVDVAVSDGRLDLAFDASVDRPKLSALEIVPLAP